MNGPKDFDLMIFWIDENWRVFAILAILAVKFSG